MKMTGVETLCEHVSERMCVLEWHENPSYKPKKRRWIQEEDDDECKKKKESDFDSIVGFTPKLLQLCVTTMQEEKEK